MASLSRVTGLNLGLGFGLGLAAASLAVYLTPSRFSVLPARSRSKLGPTPYPPDIFPGGRDVETSYGTFRLYEYGTEDAKDKVVLLHGIGTPCIALGEMADEFVKRGCRVMLFDLFGRGYSDAPMDVPHDDRLYTTQLLLAAASAGWTSFHLVGYSLGGALAASVAAYHPDLIRSLTIICPGGLVRTSHVSWRSRWLYSHWPQVFKGPQMHLARKRLTPAPGKVSADVPAPEEDLDVDFDDVLVKGGARVGDVVRWQLEHNDGFVPAYVSTIRDAPIYGQHEGRIWTKLGDELAMRRKGEGKGLESGKICLILGERDPIARPDEWIPDAERVLGKGVEAHVIKGGHEIAISRGRAVAGIATKAWSHADE